MTTALGTRREREREREGRERERETEEGAAHSSPEGGEGRVRESFESDTLIQSCLCLSLAMCFRGNEQSERTWLGARFIGLGRDGSVTSQTILASFAEAFLVGYARLAIFEHSSLPPPFPPPPPLSPSPLPPLSLLTFLGPFSHTPLRSEERRVWKEWRSRWSPYQ